MTRKHIPKYSLIVISLLLALLISGIASAAWWDSDWDSFSTVTLDLSVPDNNFQVHLSSDDFAIPQKMWMNMNQDGNDTRILHTDNSTVFPIWIEHLTAPDNYSIWVNVTDNTAGDTLLWYYENSTVSTVSDADAAFIQFHDDSTTSYHDSNVISGNLIYEAKVKRTSATHNLLFGMSDEAGTGGDSFQIQTANNVRYFYTKNDGTQTSVSESPDLPLNTFVNLKIEYSGSSAHAYVDGNEIVTGSTTNLPDESMGLWVYVATGTYTQDWAFIRSYNETDSVISNIDLTAFTNTPPTIHTAVYPLNNSYVITPAVVELNVSTFDVDGDNITVYFYGGTSLSNILFLGTNDTSDSTSYNWSVSLYDEYYWYAQAYDGYIFSDFSDTFDFTLIIPPNLTSPSNTSTLYATYPPLTSIVSFAWNDTLAPQYRLMIAEDKSFNIMSVDTHIGANITDQTLLVNKEYWWKIYSYDGTTYSDVSDVYNFNLTGNSSLIGSAIEGVVYQSNGDISAISGAEVTIWNTTWSSSMITGSNGYYVFENLNSGTVYNLQAKSDRYWDSSIALVSAEDNPVTNNFYLIDDLTDTEWWHYVEFTLQNVWGVTYPYVATNVHIGDSPTISESGNTESDGTISFHLNQNVQYHITFINFTLGINEDITLYPVATSYTVYIDSYSFDLPETVTDDIQAYIVSSRINATHGYINFTWSDTSGLTSSINYYIHDVDGIELYNTSNSGPDMFNSQIVEATDDRYIVRYVGIHPTHGTIDKTETVVFHGGRRVDFGWPHDWQYAVTALAFLIFIGALFGAKTAHYGAITVVIFAWIFKWIGWLNETNTSTLLIILAAVIAFGWSLRKSEEVKT